MLKMGASTFPTSTRVTRPEADGRDKGCRVHQLGRTQGGDETLAARASNIAGCTCKRNEAAAAMAEQGKKGWCPIERSCHP